MSDIRQNSKNADYITGSRQNSENADYITGSSFEENSATLFTYIPDTTRTSSMMLIALGIKWQAA